ncbi:MAG: lipoyl(octanoyl) transferase LipB [Dehalococcoidia bacterium]|nr:lipoyl(octanoyl) transferase LipB [Dehalococcoidia bacterium]
MRNAAPFTSTAGPDVPSNAPGEVLSLGVVDYQEAWGLQRRLVAARQVERIGDVLILLQHPHTYTLGRRATADHVLWNEAELAQRGVARYWVDRGGDITYHGPGQLVGYPILNIRERGLDVHEYLRSLEEALIRAVARCGIEAGRDPAYTGVWVEGRKLAAIGVKVSRGVTCHGFALNVNTDLSYFDGIVPCGITDRSVTSLTELLGALQRLDEILPVVTDAFAEVFGGAWTPVALETLMDIAPPVTTAVEEPRALPAKPALRSYTIQV